jgi:hypothetical protein
VYLLAGFLCFCWLKHEEDEDKAGRVLAMPGRFEVVVLFGMLSLVAQLVYWSRIVSGLNQEHA